MDDGNLAWTEAVSRGAQSEASERLPHRVDVNRAAAVREVRADSAHKGPHVLVADPLAIDLRHEDYWRLEFSRPAQHVLVWSTRLERGVLDCDDKLMPLVRTDEHPYGTLQLVDHVTGDGGARSERRGPLDLYL